MNNKFLITLSLILSTSVFSLSSSNESTASETDLWSIKVQHVDVVMHGLCI